MKINLLIFYNLFFLISYCQSIGVSDTLKITEYDSIHLLENGQYLTIKGNRKWFNYNDSLGNLVSKELFFKGNTFYNYNGGLLVQAPENYSDKIVYLQYQCYLFWDDSIGENIPDRNFHFLQPDGKFYAEEVLRYPDSFFNFAIIRNNFNLQVYSFGSDSILEPKIISFWEYPYGAIILTKNYIASTDNNGEWKRIPLNNPKEIKFDYSTGDLYYCNVVLENGNIVNIDVLNFTINK